MNGISWLIYGAEVLDSMHHYLFFIALLSGVFAVISNMYRFYEADMSNTKVKLNWPPIMAVFLFGFIMVLLPETKTVYLIASSELGETLITKPETQEIMQDVYDILRGKLGELKEDLK